MIIHFLTAYCSLNDLSYSAIETTFSCPSCRNNSKREKGVNMGGRWTCTEFSSLESGKCTSSSGKMAGTSNMLNSGMAGNSSCSSNFKATVVERNDKHDKGREL